MEEEEEGDDERKYLKKEVKLGKSGDLLGLLDCINDVAAAIAAAASPSSSSWGAEGMSGHRVETTPRLAQWRIESLSSCNYRKSDPFKIGLWNWHLTVERNKQSVVKLYPEVSSLTRDQPPIASFIIKLISLSSPDRRTIIHPGICDKQLKNNDDFVWAVETLLTGRFIIDVEFLDLKIVPPLEPMLPSRLELLPDYIGPIMFSDAGGQPSSIWTGDHIAKTSSTTALISLGRMLAEGIHTNIIINAKNGTIGAHRAVLATRSPVFRSMFSHNLREKELSAVNISDMPFDACQTFLNYLYGNFQADEFLSHRIVLLQAADKYDIADLKEACHESLLEDINVKNVLERLQTAHLYHLPKLKSSCMRFLVNFGKIYEIRDEFNSFLQSADREVIDEIFQEVLAARKGF